MNSSTTTSGLAFDIQRSPVRKTPQERAQLLENPGFGNVFTDHMVTIRYTEESGWHEPRLQPYGPLQLDPATSALHYAQEIFEGFKAYRRTDGTIACFRPDANAERFRRSARRMAMPELPDELFLGSVQVMLEHDNEWVPTAPDGSLYLRPFMISTDVGLGVNHPSKSYLYVLIASPAGSYFSGGVKPVTVWLSEDYTRAAPGGTGAAKFAGNYAASFLAQRQAVEKGCDQVVWLDAVEHRWVEEMGGMNIFFVYGSGDTARIVTPELTGTLLPGITRDSLLKLSTELGIPVSEGRVSTDQWREDAASGELTEVFACGTAAVITPVGHVKSDEGEFTIGDGSPGPVSMRLREDLVGLQYGHRADAHGWMHRFV